MTATPAIWIGTACALAVGGLVAYASAPIWLGQRVDVTEAMRAPIVQTIVATGSATTPSVVQIGAQIAGNVNYIAVDQGDMVKVGEILITMDDRHAKASADAANASLHLARAEFVQLADLTLPTARRLLDQMTATVLQARLQRDRILHLSAQSIATPQEVEDVQHAFDIADAQRQSAALSVASKSVGGSEYSSAMAELAKAQALLRLAEAELRMTVIRSPINGFVITRSVEQGAIAQAGMSLLVLAPSIPKQLVVQIDERNLGLLHLGQKALASADAYPQLTFDALLFSIDPTIDPDRGSVEVKLTVLHPPAYLKEDMTVSVDIEVASQPAALVLANAAINEAAGIPYVMLVVDGRSAKQAVKLGIRGTEATEILKGIKVGDVVVATKDTTAAAGERVRVGNTVLVK